jgi:hypothetical protein
MPLLVFIMLVLFCLIGLGLVCACASDNPSQALERAAASFSQLPGLIEPWLLLPLLAAMTAASTRRTRRLLPAPRSPAALQRFLF